MKEPTDWCVGMVVVPKAGGKVRICVDPIKLNQSVRCECLMLLSAEQTLAQLGGATVFSKLDANSEFWKVELTKESSLLTAFITPRVNNVSTLLTLDNTLWKVSIQLISLRDNISTRALPKTYVRGPTRFRRSCLLD